MLAGQLYDPFDAQLSTERERTRTLLQLLNESPESALQERRRLVEQLIGRPTDVWIQPPFYCDYGTNILLGNKIFFNFNCVVLDVVQVRIGSHVLFGPAVHLYTATHPLAAAERRTGLESGQPITIGDDVWIGGGAIVCPGVTIGARSIIGAGSVVTRNIPEDVIAAGNPCRVLHALS